MSAEQQFQDDNIAERSAPPGAPFWHSSPMAWFPAWEPMAGEREYPIYNTTVPPEDEEEVYRKMRARMGEAWPGRG